MNANQKFLPSGRALRSAVFALMAVAAPSAPAATVWTGPPITYNQPGTDPTLPANQDQITPNVWLTRGTNQGLFNAKTEAGFTHSSSPADTAWANGTTASHACLTYTDWNTWAKIINGGPPNTVGTNAVLHLISEDIYIDIKFTAWASGGGFAYQRSTPAGDLPSPTVSITNPPSGAVFAAPANVVIQADAAMSSGSVTNVAFFGNGLPLGADQAAPFSITTGSLGAGGYALTAVATAAGVRSTSCVVNITVVSPVAITLASQQITNGQFAFDHTANPGLSYVVQNSSNLVDWVPVFTNVAASALVHFTEGFSPNLNRYYRVGRQPNP